jgi:hypothetical protein
MALSLGGCAPKRVPLEMDSRFADVSKIALLPVVDARRERSEKVDLIGDVLKPVEEDLRKKGYNVVSLSAFSENTDVSADEVAEMEPSEIATLGPADAQALMLVSLNDAFSRYVVMAYTFKAEVEGVIVDKSSGRVLWKDKGVVSGGQGGLVSGILAASANPARGAAMTLMQTMPDRSH